MNSETAPATGSAAIPSRASIDAARDRLAEHIVHTPTIPWRGRSVADGAAEVFLKLELFQHTGSFKYRGAVLNVETLDDETAARGVVAVSAGNHAMAVARAAKTRGCSATIVMISTANPARVRACEEMGAKVVMAGSPADAFSVAERIERDEGRHFVHPFEGEQTVLGTATMGAELAEQCPQLDALVVPIGGGGLCAGIASAFHHWQPGCEVIGVEPEGADSMARSLRAGKPIALERVQTIADSLGAPGAQPYTFSICQALVSEVVTVSDEELRQAMRVLFAEAKLVAEPAAAASTAALLGPLRERLSGKRVALVVCGSNIDWQTFQTLLSDSA